MNEIVTTYLSRVNIYISIVNIYFSVINIYFSRVNRHFSKANIYNLWKVVPFRRQVRPHSRGVKRRAVFRRIEGLAV